MKGRDIEGEGRTRHDMDRVRPACSAGFPLPKHATGAGRLRQGRPWPPLPHTRALAASEGHARGDPMEGRVRHLIGVHLRRAFHDVRHRLQHLGIGGASIGLRVRLLVPDTDTHRFRAAWDDERYLVLEAWLCAQQGNDGVLKCPGKFATLLGFSCIRTVRAYM